MDDFPGLLARDYSFRPQGKSAPMSASKSASIGSGSASTRPANPLAFDDVFGEPTNSHTQQASFDSIFDGFSSSDLNPNSERKPKWSSDKPVYDKPVYDDDIFEGVPGMRNRAKVEYEDVFASISKGAENDGYDDLLGNFGRSSSSSRGVEAKKKVEDTGGFEELIPGFGGSSPPDRRANAETNQQRSAGPSAKPSVTMPEDPFVVLGTSTAPAYLSTKMFSDPFEHLGKPMNSGSVNLDSSLASGGIYDDMDAFDDFAKSMPSFTSKNKENRKDSSPLKSGRSKTPERFSVDSFDNVKPKTQANNSFDSRNIGQSPTSNDVPYERNDIPPADQTPMFSEHLKAADDVWLTVSEIPLFTEPTRAPPPSKLPPPLAKPTPVGRTDPRRKDSESYSQSGQSYSYSKDSVIRPNARSIDEFEDFAMGKPPSYAEVFSSEEDIETNSAAAASAAAMKEAMDKAEAKFKHAKEVRERERDSSRSFRSREFAEQEKDEKLMADRDEQEEFDREQREREEKEREQKRLLKEREKLEREKARQAVERATREARERAAAEARIRAERAAVEKANAEARQRAERAAVQRAAAEARERAASEARERAEKAAAEAKERATAEAREKAAREKATLEARERAAVERAAAEARARVERAAVDRVHAEARQRAAAAAAAAREKQNKPEHDLDDFFGMGARANSAPKQRTTTSDNPFDIQGQSRGSADGQRRNPSSSSSTIRKASSTTNIVDDLSSIFGGAPSSGEFQEVEGESEERRRARLERHQRTLERAAKAVAEKNERDMQTQRDQAERHRISETLDVEIKRWAAGKEGNLRAMLSTLQYVLWPECGWTAVSLTDLITGAAVKKAYRKATLCIHPDKVQQKEQIFNRSILQKRFLISSRKLGISSTRKSCFERILRY